MLISLGRFVFSRGTSGGCSGTVSITLLELGPVSLGTEVTFNTHPKEQTLHYPT